MYGFTAMHGLKLVVSRELRTKMENTALLRVEGLGVGSKLLIMQISASES